MKININHIDTEWESSFLQLNNNPQQTKWKKKREDYFTSEVIEGNQLFVKRISGEIPLNSFLLKCKSKMLPNVPLIHDVVRSSENNKSVYYLFQDFITGDLLEQYAVKKNNVSLNTISKSLLRSILSIHEQGYWHTDLNCENVIVKNNNQSFIIDLDSCELSKIKPTHISNVSGALTTRSNQLASHILKYYKSFLNQNSSFSFSSLPGKTLNLLQAVFLIQQVKYIRANKISTWRKSTFKNVDLITDLRNLDPFLIDDLFLSGLNNNIENEKLLQLFKLIDKNLYSNNKVSSSKQKTAPKVKKPSRKKEVPVAKKAKVKPVVNEAKKSSEKSPIPVFLGTLAAMALCGFLFFKFFGSKGEEKVYSVPQIEAKIKPQQTVSNFFSLLNSNENSAAFDLISNPKWKPFSKFNSPTGWGAFENINLFQSIESDDNLLAYYSLYNSQEGITIHRLNRFEFDEDGKISRLAYFPGYERNSLTEKAAENTVRQFFSYIENKEFRKAHYFTAVPHWGDVDYFSSSKTGWGGISHFNVEEVRLEEGQCDEGHEIVYVRYYEEDLINNHIGTQEMYFHMGLKFQEYKIVRATLSKYGDSK